MRPSQQKNRMRGRGRKQPNPMSRNFESNGPDVKIRGNASHVAEKYMTLARDASSSGDRVMAENYLQHAEHYNRIVAAAAAANSVRNEEQAGGGRGPQPEVSNSGNEEAERSDTSGEPQPKRDGRNPRQANNNRNRGRSAGRDKASDDANSETVDSSANAEVNASENDGNETVSDSPSREPRGRGRRPRKSEPSTMNGQSDGDAVEADGGADDGKTKAAKSDISSDAAKLPGNLLGVGSEAPPVTNPNNDD